MRCPKNTDNLSYLFIRILLRMRGNRSWTLSFTRTLLGRLSLP